MGKINEIPSTEQVPSGPLSWLKGWLDTVRSWAQAREPNATGDWYDKFLTRRELVEAGVIERSATGGTVGLAGGAVGPQGPQGPPGDPGTSYTPDLTPPPTPDDFTLTAGLSHLFLELPVPTYTEGNGHFRTNIYGAVWNDPDPVPTFSDIRTKLIDTVVGKPLIHSISTTMNTRWCVWIKWQSVDGVESVNPAGGTNGKQATTGQDVPALLDVLDGQITESQLYTTLGARIDLIDASSAVPGSVNARIVSSEAAQQAYVQSYTYAQATTDAIAGDVTTLKAQMNTPTIGNNPTYAAVQTEATARVGLDNSVHALYTVRVEASAEGRTVTGGFGLAATSTTAEGPRIDFGVRADRFWVAAPGTASGVTDVVPFVVQTTDETVNGVVIPKGVYMDAAYIKNLTAMVARLGNAWIDNAMIANLSADKLTAGDGTIGGDLKSTNFSAGSAGWRLRPDGTAEFAASHIRGQLSASQIDTTNLTIKNSAGDVVFSSGGSVTIDGYRTTNPNPQDFAAGEILYFKESSALGVTGAGTYGTLRTVRPYGTSSDLSGGAVNQWFESGGKVWARSSTSATTWSSWEAVPNGTITAANISTYIASAAIGSLQIAMTGSLYSGTKTSYGNGTGFLLEYNGGTPRFDIGNATNYVRWNGSALQVRGDVQATSVSADIASVASSIDGGGGGGIAWPNAASDWDPYPDSSPLSITDTEYLNAGWLMSVASNASIQFQAAPGPNTIGCRIECVIWSCTSGGTLISPVAASLPCVHRVVCYWIYHNSAVGATISATPFVNYKVPTSGYYRAILTIKRVRADNEYTTQLAPGSNGFMWKLFYKISAVIHKI